MCVHLIYKIYEYLFMNKNFTNDLMNCYRRFDVDSMKHYISAQVVWQKSICSGGGGGLRYISHL